MPSYWNVVLRAHLRTITFMKMFKSFPQEHLKYYLLPGNKVISIIHEDKIKMGFLINDLTDIYSNIHFPLVLTMEEAKGKELSFNDCGAFENPPTELLQVLQEKPLQTKYPSPPQRTHRAKPQLRVIDDTTKGM